MPLKMFGPLLKSMSMVTRGLALEVGSPSLYFALNTVYRGINTSDSASGIVGPSLQHVIETLSEGLITLMNWNNNNELLALERLHENLVHLKDFEMEGEKISLKEYPHLQEHLKQYNLKTQTVSKKQIVDVLNQLQEKIEKKSNATSVIANPTSRPMLTMSLTVGLIGIIGTAQLLADMGIGKVTGKTPEEQEEMKRFSFELLMHLTTQLELLKQTFQHIACACGADTHTQQVTAEALALIGLITVIQATSSGNTDYALTLMEGLKPSLLHGITQMEELINTRIVAGNIRGEQVEGLNLYLQQAKIALNEDNFDAFIDAYEGAFDLIGVTSEAINGDLEKIHNFAKTLWNVVGSEEDINTITGLTQA